MENKNDIHLRPSGAYEPDSAADFYEDLAKVTQCLPDYRRAYSRLGHVFQRVLDQQAGFSHVQLVGNFAKTDYLLRESEAAPALVRRVNDARVRLRKRGTLDVSTIEQYLMTDLGAVCRFVALIFGVAVPEQLTSLYEGAMEESDSSQKTVMAQEDCLRLIVTRWDGDSLWGHPEADAASEVQVCYARGNRHYDYDWSYLTSLLQEGAQVNVVRPRIEEGVYYPDLIILEPDYLVDVTAISSCFESYGESPLLHIAKRLMPAANSQDILLGNFAGQLLDEEVHGIDRNYAESVQDFFKHNAVGLIGVELDGQKFRSDSEAQRQHIHRALSVDLPQRVGSFDVRDVVLEPTFFCEMLGIQGRMDFLQLDYKVLLEQKSGKGAYDPSGYFVDPKHTEPHYVQMLLYMALIRYGYRMRYEANNQNLSAFLLYSKYTNPLLGLGSAPELLFRAVRLRNGIVRANMMMAADSSRILSAITTQRLNVKGVSGRFWDTYQAPKIHAVIDPISQASPLERAYYYRFMSFVAKEHLLSKLGTHTKENSGFAATWHDTLDDKLMAGNIYCQLRLLEPETGHTGQVSTLRFAFPEGQDGDMTNFRLGDMVIVYAYDEGAEPDVRQSIVFRGAIEDITSGGITLHLRNAQGDAHVFLRDSHRLWAIEHDFMESGNTTLYRNVQSFLTASKPRRDLLLLQREPEVDESRQLRGSYGHFDELSLRVRQARDLFLIIGPPGTGKTSYGMLNTLLEELHDPEASVLILSYTNRAVDEISSKLVKENIDFLRIGPHLSCSKEYREHLLSERVQQCRTLGDVIRLVKECRVVVATTSSMSGSQQLFSLKRFSLAIIDEASQILEPHLLGLLSARTPSGDDAIGRIVMIGDHKQLPAVVQQTEEDSAVKDPLLRDGALLTDCRLSLFERLLRRYRHDPRVCYMLCRQGRMHPDIALFPNLAFYGGKLQIVPLPHQEQTLPEVASSSDPWMALLETRRIAFIDTPMPDETSGEKVNPVEASVIAGLVERIYHLECDRFSVDDTIGIIVPYRNQIATVRSAIDNLGIDLLHGITIDTVERYQGSQRRYIIYGFTIQKHYQLNFLTSQVFEEDGQTIDRKLNVAMTRAEEHLIMVGHAPLLMRNATFARLLDFVRQRDGFFDFHQMGSL